MRHVYITRKILALCLGLLTCSVFEIGISHAQLFFSRIPPGDVVNIIRSRGFYDVAYPFYRGDIYVVDATERRGLRVRLVVDPRTGEIVERLIINRNRRVYPQGYSPPLGVERPVIDNERESRSSVEVDEPKPRAKPKRRMRTRNAPPLERTPAETPQTVIDTAPTFSPSPSSSPPSSVTIEPTRPPKVEIPEPVKNTGKPTSIPKTSIETAPATVINTPNTINTPSPPLPKPPVPVITAPNTSERGTRENPRKVGPAVPPPVGLE